MKHTMRMPPIRLCRLSMGGSTPPNIFNSRKFKFEKITTLYRSKRDEQNCRPRCSSNCHPSIVTDTRWWHVLSSTMIWLMTSEQTHFQGLKAKVLWTFMFISFWRISRMLGKEWILSWLQPCLVISWKMTKMRWVPVVSFLDLLDWIHLEAILKCSSFGSYFSIGPLSSVH